ncbi:MAG: PEGA domain-containing protein [Gemmatimonadota bacterium]
MHKSVRYAALSLVLAAVPACGALFNSGPQKVTFNSDPAGAEVWIDGSRRGATPVILDLAKNKDYTVVMKRDGYSDATTTLSKKVSAGYVVLDVLGGFIPVVVDAATGSWYVLSSDNVNLTLSARTAASGTLTSDELAAVRAGVPVSRFVTVGEAMAAQK